MTWSKSQLTSCDIPVPNAPLKDECMSYPYSVDWLSEQPMTCNLHTSLQEERMPYPCSFDWLSEQPMTCSLHTSLHGGLVSDISVGHHSLE